MTTSLVLIVVLVTGLIVFWDDLTRNFTDAKIRDFFDSQQ